MGQLENVEALTKELTIVSEDIDSVLAHAKEYTSASELFVNSFAEQIKFFGKTLSEWDEHIAILIPEAKHLTPDLIRQLHVDTINGIQIANHYLGLCSFSNGILKTNTSIKHTELVAQIIDDFHAQNLKAPSNVQIEKIVNTCLQKMSNMGNLTLLLKAYWRDKLDMLKEIKSSLNNIAMSQAMEMKYLET